MEKIKQLVHSFFQGHARSVNTKKQILYSLLLKGISVVIGLAFVPLILNYLDAERYGIWLTLSSIIGWVSFFDLGLGNGLRNRFSEAVANGNHELARTYVSTTYAILGIIFILTLTVFYCINPFLNWQKILNTSEVNTGELSVIALIVFTFFILRFFFSIIGTILLADQKSSLNNLLNALGNIVSIVIIFILTKTTSGSLTNLSAVLSVAPVAVFIAASLFFFSRDYKKYRPSFKYVELSRTRDLLGLGFKFFITQIVAIVLFSTTNFLIASFSSQKMVVEYNIAYKYLFLVNMVFSIILTPFWSAATDAYYKNDFDWLKSSLKKLNRMALLFCAAVLVLLLISRFVFELWVGNKAHVRFELTLLIAIYSIIQLLTSPSQILINAVGKLQVGLCIYITQLLVFVPFAYFLGAAYGAVGILVSIIIVELPPLFFLYRQAALIVSRQAKGIWNS
ncbi:MAG: lipopolysaccharide biosynthesis protein [Bacteroidia bacterium]